MKGLNIWDILLFPKSIYKKLNDKIISVIAGMFIIGIIDVIVPLVFLKGEALFDRGQADLIFNIAAALICSVVVGAIDVIFFAMPLYDLFGWFGKKSSVKFDNNSIIKLMKVYLLAHVLVIPVNIILNSSLFSMDIQNFTRSIPVSIQLIYFISAIYFDLIMPIWFSAIIYRGISTIYSSFTPAVKRLAFTAIFLWSTLLSYALSFIVEKLLLNLFR